METEMETQMEVEVVEEVEVEFRRGCWEGRVPPGVGRVGC
jgi:hypothetical protein